MIRKNDVNDYFTINKSSLPALFGIIQTSNKNKNGIAYLYVNISNAQVFQLPRSEYFRFYVLISLFNYYIIRLFVDINIAVLNFILSNSYS